jgi:hypothetical protein
VVGVLCLLRLRWAISQLIGSGNKNRWEHWLAIAVLAIFVWALPALLAGIVELTLVALALAFVGLAIWLFFRFGLEDFEAPQGSKTGEKYIIKKEGGKEIVYEKGFLDRKVGELHKGWDGSKETRTIFEPQVKVDKGNGFSGERRGEIEGQKGVFKKRVFDRYPTFYPDDQSEEDEDN